MSGFLRLTLDRDDDWMGELWVEASARGFSGISSDFFALRELRDFARSLAAFPLPADGVRLANVPSDREAGSDPCQVSLWARQTNRRGSVSIRVALATPFWSHEDPGQQSHVALEVATDYLSLERFSHSLERLVDGFRNEAVLEHS
jgi:hypothetical protein